MNNSFTSVFSFIYTIFIIINTFRTNKGVLLFNYFMTAREKNNVQDTFMLTINYKHDYRHVISATDSFQFTKRQLNNCFC